MPYDRDDFSPSGGKLLDKNDLLIDLTQLILNVTETYDNDIELVDLMNFIRINPMVDTLIDQGQMYTANSRITIPTGESKYAQISTGSKKVSYKPTNYFSTNENVLVEFFVNSTIDTPGNAPASIFNRNFNSINVAETEINLNPVVSDDGDRFDIGLVSAGGATSKVLSLKGGSPDKWKFEPNQEIIVKYTNVGNTSTDLIITNMFFEQ